MSSDKSAVIIGSGSYIPPRVIENESFASNAFYSEDGTLLPGNNGAIIQKFEAITGIQKRRYLSDEQCTSGVAHIAAERALEAAQMDKETLDAIIVAHNFGDITQTSLQTDLVPSLAARVKHLLQIQNPNCIPYDLIFGCPGWLQGMIQARLFIQANAIQTCMVIGAETLSRVVDPSDRDTMIFADGAGAVILQGKASNKKNGIQAYMTVSHTTDELNFLSLGKGYHPHLSNERRFIKMQGRKIYEYALSHVPQAMQQCIEKAGITLKDITKILIHQANEKMDEAIVKRLYRMNGYTNFPQSVLPMTIDRLGNSSVATIPTLYDVIARNELEGHRFKSGDYILFASVGAGMSINAMVYRV